MRKQKKYISIIVLVAFLLIIVNVPVLAAEVQDGLETATNGIQQLFAPDDKAAELVQPLAESKTSGVCGENATWTFADGVLTISGTGAMDDYRVYGMLGDDRPWSKFGDDIKKVIIENGITKIGTNSFDHLYSLEYVLIPKSVIETGDGIFEKCDLLKTAGPVGSNCNIEYGWNSSIPNEAFIYCDNLVSIILPNHLKSIGNQAFSYCTNLKNIILPETVENIGFGAFSDCKSLEEFIIPDGVKVIEGITFLGCSKLQNIVLPDSIIEMKPRVFEGCISLESVDLPKNISYIGSDMFYNCTNLKQIDIPESVLWIGAHAFDSCDKLQRIEIPSNVAKIYLDAFSGCDQLSHVIIKSDNLEFSGWAFDKDPLLETAGPIGGGYNIEFAWTKKVPGGAFACFDYSGLKEVTLPDTIHSIGENAFVYCDKLTSITFPKELTEIKRSAFYGCKNLNSVYFTGNAPRIDQSSFDNVITTAYYPDNNKTWSDDILRDYGGDITWVPYKTTDPIAPEEPIDPSNPSSGSSSGGFSGSYNYPVKADDVDGATVYLDKSNAVAGEKVVVTVTPDAGKQVDEVIVTDEDNEIITVTRVGDNKYNFIMPEGAVKVSVITVKADYDTRVVLQIGNKNVVINDRTFSNDVAPVIVADRTMVPIRVITEALGGKADWSETTCTVTLTIDGKVLRMTIDKTIPGFDAAPVIMNSRTYVPIRYVAEALSADVEWIKGTQQIIIEK